MKIFEVSNLNFKSKVTRTRFKLSNNMTGIIDKKWNDKKIMTSIAGIVAYKGRVVEDLGSDVFVPSKNRREDIPKNVELEAMFESKLINYGYNGFDLGDEEVIDEENFGKFNVVR